MQALWRDASLHLQRLLRQLPSRATWRQGAQASEHRADREPVLPGGSLPALRGRAPLRRQRQVPDLRLGASHAAAGRQVDARLVTTNEVSARSGQALSRQALQELRRDRALDRGPGMHQLQHDWSSQTPRGAKASPRHGVSRCSGVQQCLMVHRHGLPRNL
jgi:hypothetical protein